MIHPYFWSLNDMLTEIDIITRPACPPNRFKYKFLPLEKAFPSLFVLEYLQFFFPKDIGMNKGDIVNHEYNIKDKRIYWHIVVGNKGDRIVSEASNQFSINAGPICKILQLSNTHIHKIINFKNIRSIKIDVYKNIYRELDRSGKQKNKDVSIGFCFSLSEIIDKLGLNHEYFLKTLID